MSFRERFGLSISNEPQKEQLTPAYLTVTYGTNDFCQIGPKANPTPTIPVVGINYDKLSIGDIYTKGLTPADPRSNDRIRLSQLIDLNFNGGKNPFIQTLIGLKDDGTQLLVGRYNITPKTIGALDFWDYNHDFTTLAEGNIIYIPNKTRTTPFWVNVDQHITF